MHEQDFDEVAERGRYTVSTLRKGDKHKGEVLRSGETKPAWTSDLSYETEFEAAGMARCYVGALVDKARRIHDLKVARSEALAGRLTINYEKIAELDGEKRKVSSAIKRLEILNRDLIREADSPSVEVRFSETIGTYTLVVREEGEEVEEAAESPAPRDHGGRQAWSRSTMIEPDPKVLSVMTAVRVTAAARPKSIIEVVMRIVDALSTDCGWPKDREAGREFIPLIGAALDLYLAPPQPGSPPARSIQ